MVPAWGVEKGRPGPGGVLGTRALGWGKELMACRAGRWSREVWGPAWVWLYMWSNLSPWKSSLMTRRLKMCVGREWWPCTHK